MSPFDWVVFGFAVLLAIAAVRNLPRVWRHEFRHQDRVPDYWPWGEALWHGYVRAIPVGTFTILIGIAVLGLGLLVPEEPTGPLVRPYWYVLPAFSAMGIVFLTMVMIVFFNRPKRLVAPHLRRQPGAIAFWLRAWRRKRARSRRTT